MALKQRARKEEDKQARRDAILAVAARSLGRRQFARVTMAEIAEQCGLAKGTLYLYFNTKEELFLAALERELAQWFDAVGARLIGSRDLDAAGFGRLVARSLVERETLADLLALLHTVLEANVEPDAALSFKRMLRDRLELAGRGIEVLLHGLPRGGGVRLLLHMHALVVGLRQMSDPPPNIAQVLEREELALLRLDFETELAAALTDLVRGMMQRGPHVVAP
jgi:AcrR family transcriptional regulator